MKIFKKIRAVLIVLILTLLCLLVYSERWFLTTWDTSIAFSTIVYQLFSPLKGTGTEIIQSYINNCVRPTLVIVGICLALSVVLYSLKKRLIFSLEIRVGGQEIVICSDYDVIKSFERMTLAMVFGVMCFFAWRQAVTMGAVDYLKQIMQRSTIFEEEYIDPKEIDITYPDQKRNLILIYLESMETTYASVEAGGAKPINYIPELTELAFNNVFFSNDEDLGGAYASTGTGWTMAALLGTSTGVPYKLGIGGNDADRYESFLPGITAMGDILLDCGYKNYFMCGSDISFAGRKDFYLQHGNYALIDLNTVRKSGLIAYDYYNGFWGMEDEKLFAAAKVYLSDAPKQGEPFNFTLLTVDTHHPNGYICDCCDAQYDEQYANVISCSSRQVSDFVEWIQEQSWYENTSIVIVGDHLSMNGDFWSDIGENDRTIYNCFINLPDDLDLDQTQNRVFTSLDLFPSILAATGAKIDGERLGLGVNLFSEEPTVPERIGIDEFNSELGKYSQYYFKNFIIE